MGQFPSPQHQFKPGQTGNPRGRPKTITNMLREILADTKLGNDEVPDGKTVGEALAVAIIQQALKGNAPYLKAVLERVDPVELGASLTDAGALQVEDDAVLGRFEADDGDAGGEGGLEAGDREADAGGLRDGREPGPVAPGAAPQPPQ